MFISWSVSVVILYCNNYNLPYCTHFIASFIDFFIVFFHLYSKGSVVASVVSYSHTGFECFFFVEMLLYRPSW